MLCMSSHKTTVPRQGAYSYHLLPQHAAEEKNGINHWLCNHRKLQHKPAAEIKSPPGHECIGDGWEKAVELQHQQQQQ